jgi:hypothetical protein
MEREQYGRSTEDLEVCKRNILSLFRADDVKGIYQVRRCSWLSQYQLDVNSDYL